jgi:hypothetical protein
VKKRLKKIVSPLAGLKTVSTFAARFDRGFFVEKQKKD